MEKEQMKELICNLLEYKLEQVKFDSRDRRTENDILERVDEFRFFLSDGTGPCSFYFVVTKTYNVRNNENIANARFLLRIYHGDIVHLYADDGSEAGCGDVEALYNYCNIRQKVNCFYKHRESTSNILLAAKKLKEENQTEKKNG